MSGRTLSEQGRRAFIRDKNHESNMRIKSEHCNVVLDERRDARIAAAFVSGESIQGGTTAQRAYQSYTSASSFHSMDSLAAALGELRVYNPSTGRTLRSGTTDATRESARSSPPETFRRHDPRT